MTKDEKSLLLYFETRAVDYEGKVDTCKMNSDDMKIAKMWNETGFVRFGRIAFNDITRINRIAAVTHWCELSEEAWKAAHSLRKKRAERGLKNRTWNRTEEL